MKNTWIARNIAALGLTAWLCAAPAAASTSAAIATADAASRPTAMTHPLARERIDLAGPWHYIIDPLRIGLRKPGTRRNLALDEPDRNHPLIEYSWDSSPTMQVPGDWNSQVRELFWYEGMVWLRRTLTAAPTADRRYFLYFEAVNYHARVYLNGKLLGEHEGGFTPFQFEVTDQLLSGRNSLVVSVDNRHHAQSLPGVDFDWHNYGGITRGVHLLDVPVVHVHDYRLRLLPGARVEAQIQVSGADSAAVPVSVEIPELKLKLTGRTDIHGRTTLAARIGAPLRRWSPDDPKLYRTIVAAGSGTSVDRVEDQIGLRSIEVQGPVMMLNGERLLLRGVAMHEESLGANPTRAVSPADARALLMEAKALGANFVRLAHYPHAEHTLRLADELGLLVWSEIPVYWELPYADPVLLVRGRTMLREMIMRDRNRASIIIWAVANETPVEAARNEFLRALIREARSADNSRLIAAALDLKPGQEEPDGSRGLIRVRDPIGADLDLLGFNRYDGWYGDLTPTQIDSVRWETIYDKPLILSEFGADAVAGHRGDPGLRWTEDYQAAVIDGFTRMSTRIPNFAGLSAWVLKDFRSPRRFHGTHQQYWNRKGLIAPDGTRKLAFGRLREWFLATEGTDGAATATTRRDP